MSNLLLANSAQQVNFHRQHQQHALIAKRVHTLLYLSALPIAVCVLQVLTVLKDKTKISVYRVNSVPVGLPSALAALKGSILVRQALQSASPVPPVHLVLCPYLACLELQHAVHAFLAIIVRGVLMCSYAPRASLALQMLPAAPRAQ